MIEVTVDDLAFLDVEAILRPAGDRLQAVTPAIARLDERGGEAFAGQRRLNTPLEPGAAVVTGGGDLTARLVVHAVVQSADRNPDRDTIRRALTSAWQRCGDWGISALAVPLVGTGAGQLSEEEALSLLVETFQSHRQRSDHPESLTIVVERADERARLLALLERLPL